jgi:hypothetical protein
MGTVRLIVFGLLTLVLIACGTNSTTPRADSAGDVPAATENVVEVGLTEYTFEMPDEVVGGTVTFRATNTGGLPHEMAFGAIEGDRTVDDVMDALQSRRRPKWFEDIAGIPVVSAGLTAAMTRDLDEGRYIFLCFLPTPEGQPHASEGMVKLFTVGGTSDAATPDPDVVITATDEGFDIPEIAAGTRVVKLVNEGTKPHEFAFVSFEPGKTEKDLGKWFNSGFKTDTPALFPGGIQAIEPGTSVVVEITFESGKDYTLQDFENGLQAEIVVE